MENQQTSLKDSTLTEIPWVKRIGKKIDLTNQTFGRLTVIEEAPPRVYQSGRKIYMWKCRCECGNICTVATSDLRSGHTASCGCYQKECASEAKKTHGKSKERLYNIYKNMHKRCDDPSCGHYKWYGGKGISVCHEWSGDNGVAAFFEWALNNGYSDELTIDRIDGNKGYSPDNCRWATRKQQSNNIKSNVILTYNGKDYTLSELAEYAKMPRGTLRTRIFKLGMEVKNAVEKPINAKSRNRRAKARNEVQHSQESNV